MGKRFTLLLIMYLAVACVPAMAHAAEFSLPEVLSGKAAPLRVTLKEIDGSWLVLTVAPPPTQQLQAMLHGRHSSDDAVELPPVTYYTRGAAITCAGESYLLAYAAAPESMNPDALVRSMLERGDDDIITVANQASLSLSLLHLRTVGKPNFVPVAEPPAGKLAAQMTAVFERSRRAHVRKQSLDALRLIATAIELWRGDHDGAFPNMADAQALARELAVFGFTEELLMHPATKKRYLPNPTLSGKQLSSVKNPRNTVLLYSPSPDADGIRCVAFADGHLEEVHANRWVRVKGISGIK